MAITDLTNTTWQLNNTITETGIKGINFPLTGTVTSGEYSISISNFNSSNDYTDFFMFGTVLPWIQYYNLLWQYRVSADERITISAPTFAITGGSATTNSDLIAWFQNNATQLEVSNALEVTYNGTKIVDTNETGTHTLSCANKVMSSDIVIALNDSLSSNFSVKYNNQTIVNTNETGTYTLSTNNKFMLTDVIVNLGDLYDIVQTGSTLRINAAPITQTGGTLRV